MKTRQSIKASVYNRRGKLLAFAYNNYIKTHPRQAYYAKQVGQPLCVYLHAEIAAIIKAQKVGVPYKIKIERYTKNGKQALAAPCPICLAAIHEADIKLVEFSVGE